MDEIVNKACECASELTSETDPESYNMKLGLCILEVAADYESELLRDHNIDFDQIDVEGERLGRIIGMKMAGVCPEVFQHIADIQNGDAEVENEVVVGKVSKIESGTFIIFHISVDGQTRKYYWITEVESNIDLSQSFNSVLEKNVEVTAQLIDVFDPRIQEYRTINVLSTLYLTDQ